MKKKLTIAVIMQSPDMGGAETYMLSLIKYFLKDGNTVLVASNKEKFLTKAQDFPIKTYEIPMILDINGNIRGLIKSIIRLPAALRYYKNLLSDLKKQNTDIILMSNFAEKLLVTFLSPNYAIPTVWIEYGRMETVFKRNFYIPQILYRHIQKTAKKIVVPSKNTYESLISSAHVNPNKLVLLPLGIETNKSKKITDKQLFPNSNNKFILGTVSRLTREKGQEYIIRAMPKILQSVPNAHLLLIGDGPDKGFYQNLVITLGIQEHVTITGYVKDVTDYYVAMDVFVFTTVWDLEGFGLVTPEAMLHKLPVIATTQPPVPEIVDNLITGELVPPRDSDALANKVISFYKDTSKMKKYGENGYKKVLKEYELTTVVKKMLTIFHSI